MVVSCGDTSPLHRWEFPKQLWERLLCYLLQSKTLAVFRARAAIGPTLEKNLKTVLMCVCLGMIVVKLGEPLVHCH